MRRLVALLALAALAGCAPTKRLALEPGAIAYQCEGGKVLHARWDKAERIEDYTVTITARRARAVLANAVSLSSVDYIGGRDGVAYRLNGSENGFTLTGLPGGPYLGCRKA